jgi:Cu-Zn family superoxide dismutase
MRAQSVTIDRPLRRRLTLAVATAMVALLPVGCAYEGLTLPAITAMTLQGDGALTRPTPEAASRPNTGGLAYTYNPALAPEGARFRVVMKPSGESTTAELTVSGLLPNRGYSVVADNNACSPNPAAEGPHYQNRVDPGVNPTAVGVASSTNPEYANPRNEVWLDVRTDGSGSGTSRTTVPFVFTDRGPGSVVIHEAEQTATEAGKAGNGGAPIACLSLSPVRPGQNPRGSE